jgi:GTP-binding protein
LAVGINACQFVGSFFDIGKLPKANLPHIAFAGRSNVGKSSLLNSLVGQKKMAKVSQTPGKTQSINLFMVNRNCYFADLPGYGYAKVPVAVRKAWGALMEKYLTQAEQLAGLVQLIDIRRDPTEEDRQMLGWLSSRELPALLVATKADKLTRNKANQAVAKLSKTFGVDVVAHSTISGDGKRELTGAILSLVQSYHEHKD